MGYELLDKSNYIEVEEIPCLNIPELEEIGCVTPADNPDREYIIFAKPKKKYRGGCPYCGSLDYYSHGYAQNHRLIHDISMGLSTIVIELKTPRYKCNDCGKSFHHRYEDIRLNEQFTERLYQQLKERSMQECFSDLAGEYHLSIDKIRKIMKERGSELEERRGVVFAPRVLGIDEKHIGHKMRGVFVDIEEGALLEMTKDNKQKTVIDTIFKMKNYDKIEIVTMDMANAYKPAVEEALPWAKIIVDKFHVLQDHTRKVQECKKIIVEKLQEELKELPKDDEERIKKEKLLTKLGKNNRLFVFNEENIGKSRNRISLMSSLCKEFEEFNMLRMLKAGLERMYKQESREEAEKIYYTWEQLVKSADSKTFTPMKTMYRTTQRWYDEIMGYFDEGCQVTNAACEGINSVIQAVNEKGRGYGFEVLRYKCLFYEPAELKPKQFSQKNRLFEEKPSHTFGFATPGKGTGPGGLSKNKPVERKGTYIDKLLEAIENDKFF